MSLIKLQGNASGTGAFTIAAPNGNTDRTLTLPDATGTVNVSGLANEVPAGSAGAPAIYPTGDSNTGIFFPAADTIAFAEGGVEAARFDSSGRLSISTTNTSGRLTVASPDNSGSTNIITAISNNLGQSVSMTFTGLKANSGAGIGFVVNESTGALTIGSNGQKVHGYDAGADPKEIFNWSNNTTGMSFRSASIQRGSIYFLDTGVSFNTTSDYRLKEDWQPLTGASERVLALKPVNFAWKENGKRVDGFLAHEAQAVVPEAVTGTKDEVDDEGNPKYQGIDQSKLVPLLTAALQEALAEIANLKTRLTALEAN